MRRSAILLLALAALGTIVAMWPERRGDPPPPRVLAPRAAATAPLVRPSDPILGPTNATHTIIMVGDFSCPACADALPILASLRTEYGEALRIVWKDFPHLDRIAGSTRLHIAARCAHEQGVFWAYHDALYATHAREDATLNAIAQSLSINLPQFTECRSGARAVAAVAENEREATAHGIDGTPTFFVDGTLLDDHPTRDAFLELLDPSYGS